MRHKPESTSSSGGGGRPRRFSQEETTNPLKLTLPSPRASHRSPSPKPAVQASSSMGHGSPHRSHSPSRTTPMTPPQTPTSASPPSSVVHQSSSRHSSPLQLQPQQLLQHQQHIPSHQLSPMSPRLKDAGEAFVISDLSDMIPPPTLPLDISTTNASSVSTPPAGTPSQDFHAPTSRLSASPVATPPPPNSYGISTSDHIMDKLDTKSYGYNNQVIIELKNKISPSKFCAGECCVLLNDLFPLCI